MTYTPADVAMVVVNWNSAEEVIRVVKAVSAEHPGILSIVVDNNSDDPGMLATLEAHALIDRRHDNGGYAAGVNRGLELARERGREWAWLMNPDALPYPGSLPTLLAVSDGCGLLGPRQLSSAAPLDPAAVQYVTAANLSGSKTEAETCSGCSRGFHDVQVVTGTGLLVRVNAAHEVGLFNEDFFHYKEEFEFAERMSRSSTVRYVCAARIWHQKGGSLAQTSAVAEYYRVRNELLYLRVSLRSPWLLRSRTWRWVARSIALAARSERTRSRSVLRGVAHGLMGRTGRYA